MSVNALETAAVEIWGERGWQTALANALGVNRSALWRWRRSGRVPGPVAAAVKCWLTRYRETRQRPPRIA